MLHQYRQAGPEWRQNPQARTRREHSDLGQHAHVPHVSRSLIGLELCAQRAVRYGAGRKSSSHRALTNQWEEEGADRVYSEDVALSIFLFAGERSFKVKGGEETKRGGVLLRRNGVILCLIRGEIFLQGVLFRWLCVREGYLLMS